TPSVMRVFTLMLVLTLTLGFLTTAESYSIPKIFKDILMYQRDWDVIGPYMEIQIPQYVVGAETFSGLKQLYGNALKTFRTGRNSGWRFKDIGLTDALKAFDPVKIEQAIFRSMDKLSSNAVYRLSDKIANALRYGVRVGGQPIVVTIEMIANEMGVAAQVE
ncbi:16319_t:CDS:2, partial [Rhizophagus irregularis]